MTDAINTKVKALELANIHTPSTPADTVARAAAYNAFLTGGAATAGATGGAAGATGGAAGKPDKATTPGATGAASNKPAGGAATTNKPADKGAADKAAATAAAKAAAEKAAADKAKAKPDAAKPGAAGAAGANATAPAADTKAPGGKNTYADVVNALRKVKDKTNKEDAVAILVEDGGGAKSVRDLKPALYDAVVEACDNVLADEGTSAGEGGGQVEDPTAQPERDELGL